MKVWDERGFSDLELVSDVEFLSDDTEEYTQSPLPSRHPNKTTTYPERSKTAEKPLAARIFSPANLGLVTLFLPSPTSQHKRQDDVAHTVRLNMSRVYLKFVIQALLYLLSTYIFISAATLFFKLSCLILIPIAILCALQLAARSMMHVGLKRLHHADAYQHYSLTNDIIWASNKYQGVIDHASDFALGLFSFIPQKLAQTTILDRQMGHISGYSSQSTRLR